MDRQHMDEKYKSHLIQELEQELADASNISKKTIAEKIESIGFSCLMCGKCCRRAFGDNTVLLIPKEIQLIANHTGMDPDEIRTPAISDDPELTDLTDEKGRIHTFGWMLLRKKNEDCNFIEDSDVSNRCKIHNVRPMLCRTYPFHMQEMELHVSDCEGLGSKITPKDSLKMASDVIDRYVVEIEDTIALYEKFEGIATKPKCTEIAATHPCGKKDVVYVVHDSNGTHELIKELDEGTNFID